MTNISGSIRQQHFNWIRWAKVSNGFRYQAISTVMILMDSGHICNLWMYYGANVYLSTLHGPGHLHG